MPNPDAVVAQRIVLEPSFEGDPDEVVKAGLTVELDGERRVRLDPGDERASAKARALDAIRREGRPVYLEIDPASDVIRAIRLPLVTQVVGIEASGDGLEVELQDSHARHLVRPANADAADLERTLREALETRAPLLVTSGDRGEIIDVRLFRPAPDGPGLPFPDGPIPPPGFPPRPKLPPWLWWPISILWRLLRWLWWWVCYPWWWWRCPSPTRARTLFDAMAVRVCNPLAIGAPCIPFNYPDDGCWGRAHEMARLMIAMGTTPRKVWIDRSGPALHVDTSNNPDCYVEWGWHVAPTICVRSGFFLTERMVIDPALFTGPVTVATWKGVQHNPNATLTHTDWTAFAHGTYATDPTFSQTNAVLARYRTDLLVRVASYGPPPYAGC